MVRALLQQDAVFLNSAAYHTWRKLFIRAYTMQITPSIVSVHGSGKCRVVIQMRVARFP